VTIRLDAESIASLAIPTGWTATTRALFAARYLQTLMGIRAIAVELADQVPAALMESGFPVALDVLKSAPVEIQQQVLGHPSTAFWTDVAWDLIRRRAPERFPQMHLVPHLQEFGRFSAAAVLLTERGHLTTAVRADGAGRVTLPGAMLAVTVGHPWERGVLSVRDGAVTGSMDQLQVPRLAAGPELNWLDRDLRLGGRANFAFTELDPAAARQWADILNRHLDLLGEVSPPLAEEVTAVLRVIVPVSSPGPGYPMSGSFREAPGMTALSLAGGLATLEMLVHEYGHHKLNAILPLDPLIDDDTGEAAYYSPWRDDPRPLTGLLHAIYSFETALNFYYALLGKPGSREFDQREAVNRAYRIVRQVRDGLAELRIHAAFSPLGRVLAEALADRVRACEADLPAPAREDRQRADAEHEAHRARWAERYPSQAVAAPPGTKGITAVNPHGAAALATLRALGLPDYWSPRWITGRWYPGDLMLSAVRAMQQEGPAIRLPDTRPGESLITDLAVAHVAYVGDDYPVAALRYAACVNHAPDSPYLWQCYAFALRHLGRYDEALYILVHTETLMARAVPVSPDRDVRENPDALQWGLALTDARPTPPAGPVEVPASAAVLAELRASRYWEYVVATVSGGQLPALIAVANGLKPAMDVWVPCGGWHALRSVAAALGLEYHVDACFDRHSPQLAAVPPDQLTTTRAAFTPTLGEHAEAHVFLARDRAALQSVVSAGWYPLVVDEKLVNKHLADHDKFGIALGYPACCRDFFRRRNNWHEDNSCYAALLNTRGEPSALCNPFIRHGLFGLVSYMPCSYDCTATAAYATALHDIISVELPEYARAVDLAAVRPLLCVSEVRIYGFGGETVRRRNDAVTITYTAVERLYPVEATDPLHELLAAGDCCVVDNDIITVYKGGSPLDGYQARGDRYGPECPFVISFASNPSGGVSRPADPGRA
jgi:HEXXH motif-containing protein